MSIVIGNFTHGNGGRQGYPVTSIGSLSCGLLTPSSKDVGKLTISAAFGAYWIQGLGSNGAGQDPIYWKTGLLTINQVVDFYRKPNNGDFDAGHLTTFKDAAMTCTMLLDQDITNFHDDQQEKQYVASSDSNGSVITTMTPSGLKGPVVITGGGNTGPSTGSKTTVSTSTKPRTSTTRASLESKVSEQAKQIADMQQQIAQLQATVMKLMEAKDE